MKSNHQKFFLKSNISIMYNPGDLSRIEENFVDCITWGSQINPIASEIERQKDLFRTYRSSRLKFFSIDTSLTQEGGKYAICGDTWDASCDNLFWKMWNGSLDISSVDPVFKETILNRAVIDRRGEIVGVPWRLASGISAPMACVNDPGYRRWLFRKMDVLLSTNPMAIHFDGPLMGAVSVKSYGQGCFSDFSIQGFRKYLEKKTESFLEKHKISDVHSFNIKTYINTIEKPDNNSMSLWREFQSFSILSAADLLNDLVNYAKKNSETEVLISANISPLNWKTIPLASSLDFISAEISHLAKNRRLSNLPLIAYKMAEAIELPIFTTAYGKDWQSVKENNDHLLVCAWIAQAYAMGQYMNFPLKTWIPGGEFTPKEDIYLRLLKWIKEHRTLFDDYKTMAFHSLILPKDIFRNQADRSLAIEFMEQLFEKGILFKIIPVGGISRTPLDMSKISNTDSLINVFPNYYSTDTLEKLSNLSNEKIIINTEGLEVKKSNICDGMGEISVPGIAEKDVFCFPRQKDNEEPSVVIHILNRDYSPIQKTMKEKCNFTISLLKDRFSKFNPQKAVFHQFPVSHENRIDSVSEEKELLVYERGNYFCIDIPQLSIWGILELKAF